MSNGRRKGQRRRIEPTENEGNTGGPAFVAVIIAGLVKRCYHKGRKNKEGRPYEPGVDV